MAADSLDVVSPISAGLAGIERSLEMFQKAAEAVADPEGGGDPIAAILLAKQAKAELQTNVAVVKTANDMTGTLIDLFA